MRLGKFAWTMVAALGAFAASPGSDRGLAHACSHACSPPVRLFGANASVPADLVLFKITVPDPGALSLRTVDGAEVAARIRMMGADRVFAPDVPPPAGVTLRLHYNDACYRHSGAEARQYEFRTHEPLSTSPRPAELRVIEQGVQYPGQPDREAVFFRLRHQAPEVSGSAEHLMDHAATVDGRPTAFFQGAVDVITRCLPVIPSWRATQCNTYDEVPPGKHTVEVTTSVVGAEAQPVPVRLEVDTRCDQTFAVSAAPATAERAAATADAGTREQAPVGCTIANTPRPGSTTMMALLAMVAVAIMVARRSRRRH
jgi:hypothetical protein